MAIDGIMGQSGITNLAKENEYAKRVNLYPPCTTRKMTEEEKRRYENMNGSGDKAMTNRRGPKPRQVRYCLGCDETLYVKESQITDNAMITCHSCGASCDAVMLAKTPRGGAAQHKPESLEGRTPAIINPDFEKAVQEMEAQKHCVSEEPIDACCEKAAEIQEVYAPEGISEALADIIYKFTREHKRGYEEGFEAGKAAAAKALMETLQGMGA